MGELNLAQAVHAFQVFAEHGAVAAAPSFVRVLRRILVIVELRHAFPSSRANHLCPDWKSESWIPSLNLKWRLKSFFSLCIKVGYLIGHYGRTIWGFERTTGAKIDILRPNSHDYETPVAISGSAEGVRHVLRQVLTCIIMIVFHVFLCEFSG